MFPILLDTLTYMFVPLHHQSLPKLLQRNFFKDLLDRSPDFSIRHKLHTMQGSLQKKEQPEITWGGGDLDCKEDDEVFGCLWIPGCHQRKALCGIVRCRYTTRYDQKDIGLLLQLGTYLPERADKYILG